MKSQLRLPIISKGVLLHIGYSFIPQADSNFHQISSTNASSNLCECLCTLHHPTCIIPHVSIWMQVTIRSKWEPNSALYSTINASLSLLQITLAFFTAESQAQFTAIFLLAKEPIYPHLYPTHLTEEHPACSRSLLLPHYCLLPPLSHHFVQLLPHPELGFLLLLAKPPGFAPSADSIYSLHLITKSPIKISKSDWPMHQPFKNATANKHSVNWKHEEHLLAWPLAPRKMDVSYLFPNFKYFGIHPTANSIPSLFWQKHWIWKLKTWFVNLTLKNLRTFHCSSYHTCLHYFWLLFYFIFAITKTTDILC